MSLDDDLAEYQRLIQLARKGQRVGAEINQLRQAVRQRYNRLGREDAEWLLDHLSTQHVYPDTNAFVGMVLEVAHQLPDSLFQSLIRAAVYETNPSTNRYFAEPAVRAFGFQRVAERLLEYLNDGTNFEKGGAANAFYWARVAARDDKEPYTDLRQRIRDKYLTEFVSNADTQVRRCIIPSLDTDESAYSPDIRGLVAVAIEIARNHEDDYIRHRIEVQLGNERLLYPLPERAP
jgi:hypothetical protein